MIRCPFLRGPSTYGTVLMQTGKRITLHWGHLLSLFWRDRVRQRTSWRSEVWPPLRAAFIPPAGVLAGGKTRGGQSFSQTWADGGSQSRTLIAVAMERAHVGSTASEPSRRAELSASRSYGEQLRAPN